MTFIWNHFCFLLPMVICFTFILLILKIKVHIRVKNEEDDEKEGFLQFEAKCSQFFIDLIQQVQEKNGPPDLMQKRKNDIEITIGANRYSFNEVKSLQVYTLIDHNYDVITVNIRKKRCIYIFTEIIY